MFVRVYVCANDLCTVLQWLCFFPLVIVIHPPTPSPSPLFFLNGVLSASHLHAPVRTPPPPACAITGRHRAANATYNYMTQPWVIDLFLNCKQSNYVADKRYGGAPLLQCPNETTVARFKRAVKLGDISWHAAATDQEAGYFPNAGIFEASLTINERLAAQLGVPPATAVSTRDVPGWTRAAIPLLHKVIFYITLQH